MHVIEHYSCISIVATTDIYGGGPLGGEPGVPPTHVLLVQDRSLASSSSNFEDKGIEEVDNERPSNSVSDTNNMDEHPHNVVAWV